MKIDIQKIDLTQFMVHEHSLNGEIVYLIQPQHIGTKWTQDNKHMRSVVVNYAGEVISAGFPKFTNWGENPDHFPVPNSLKHCTVVEKLDGSLLIVSKYNGQYILRTRGTVDASIMANGHELEIFKNAILKKLDELSVDVTGSWNYSMLFEWVSPINKIVLNYGDEPDWYLVGVVNHINYSLQMQDTLNEFARVADLKRPATYTFPGLLASNSSNSNSFLGRRIFFPSTSTMNFSRSIFTRELLTSSSATTGRFKRRKSDSTLLINNLGRIGFEM